jgi:hypothetical protein
VTRGGAAVARLRRVRASAARDAAEAMCDLCPQTRETSVCDECSEWLWLEGEPMVTVHSDEPMFGRAIHRQGLVCQ